MALDPPVTAGMNPSADKENAMKAMFLAPIAALGLVATSTPATAPAKTAKVERKAAAKQQKVARHAAKKTSRKPASARR
jgi:hypothetical protein